MTEERWNEISLDAWTRFEDLMVEIGDPTPENWPGIIRSALMTTIARVDEATEVYEMENKTK